MGSLEPQTEKRDAPSEPLELRAGQLSASFEAGMLRYLRWGELEVLRGVYPTVRDSHWGTVAAQWSQVSLEQDTEHFSLELDALYLQGDLDFRASLSLEGRAEGTLRVSFAGEAHSSFFRNRIGLCLLYPMSAAGANFRLHHTDGRVGSAPLPLEIVGAQPLPGFENLKALEHPLSPGLSARVRLEGEEFEMEDQRNWTDASFKLFGTPLSKPFPVRLERGARVEQRVTLELLGSLETVELVSYPKPLAPTVLTMLEQTSPLPALGLCLNANLWSDLERERLRALHLSHLRAELFLAGDFQATLERATQQARSLDLPLELALVFSDRAEVEAQHLKRVLERLKPPVVRWLVFHQDRHSTPAFVVQAARAHLQDYAPHALFGGGANTDFIFVNQFPPPLEHLDLLSFAVNPQVHAFDDASLMETLEAQQTLLEHARKVSGKPVGVSPVTLEPRWNPYTAPSRLQPGALEGKTPDPRLHAAFAAAWTVGSLRALAQGRAHTLSYFETTGYRGVLEGETLYPLYEVFRRLAAFRGGQVRHTRSSDPLGAVALWLEHSGRRAALLANLSAKPNLVRLEGFRLSGATAFSQPESLVLSSLSVQASPLEALEEVLELSLGPFEVLWLEPETP